MAMYSFSLESFAAVACRSAGGRDDVWLIVTVAAGARGMVATLPIGIGVQAEQGFTGPWSAGPYQMAAGETGVAVYTLANLAGSSPEDQEIVVAGLGVKILAAVEAAVAGGAGAAAAGGPSQAVRDVFGPAGELLGGTAVPAGEVDCRGLVGVYVSPFTAANGPGMDDVQTSDDVQTTGTETLTAAAPASCGSGPRSTAVFSVRRSPNLFSQSTPVTALASAGPLMEMFAVGMDGLVRYNARSGQGTFGAWQVASGRTFSQSAPLVALAGPQRKDVFGIGTDGVIYRWPWTQAVGWGAWTAVSTLGQFLPDTPVSAISLSGVVTLAAVDPDGVAQSITWDGEAVRSAWGPLPGMTFERRTPLLLISHIDPWVEVFAVSPQGQDFHTSRANTAPTWGPWQAMVGTTPEPSSRRYCGLTFDVFSGASSTGLGMAWYRVDGSGGVNELRWTNGTGWIVRRGIPGIKTIFAGRVSGVRMGNQLLLYMVDIATGRIGVASWSMPVPFNANTGWSGWTLLPSGPALAKDREITAVSTDDTHVELFVADREGLVQQMILDTRPGWNPWMVV